MTAFRVCPICRRERYVLKEEGICIDCAAERAWVQKYGPGSVAEALAPVLGEEKEVEAVSEQVLEEVAAVVNQNSEEEDHPAGGNKKSGRGICRRCGREMVLKSRGLCGTCWKKEHENTTPRYRLVLDLTPYPELWEALRERARRDFRTVELEVLFLLHQALLPGEAA